VLQSLAFGRISCGKPVSAFPGIALANRVKLVPEESRAWNAEAGGQNTAP